MDSDTKLVDKIARNELILDSEPEDIEKGRNRDEAKENVDTNLVTWESSDDPMNPKNWCMRDKWVVTLLISFFLLATLMSSTIISPALPAIANSLGITDDVELQLTMSIFVLGYAFGPLFIAPLSELYGRVIVVQISNVWFVIWSIVCGFATTRGLMITGRLMSGIGGSAALAIGGGIVSDVWAPEQRGRSLALYSFIPLLGPAIGPILGGYISQEASWNWSFWILAIFEAVLLVLSIFIFRETYAPIILTRKVKALRIETGNQNLYTEHEQNRLALLPKLAATLIRPTRLLVTHPIIQILSLYSAYSFGLLYIVHSTFPTLWLERYHQSVSQSGLNLLSNAIGATIGAQVGAPITDRIWQHLRKKAVAANSTPSGSDLEVIPEYRVPLMLPGAMLVPVGILIYGWCAQYHTHWIGPNIGIAIFSAGTTIGTQCQTAYVVDAYPDFTASALAAITVLKFLAGFAFPLFAPRLYDTLDYGIGNTLLAGLAILLGIPMPWVLWKYGAKIRAKTAIWALVR